MGGQQVAAAADVTTVFQLSQEHVSGGLEPSFGLGPAFYPTTKHNSIGRRQPLQQQPPHSHSHQNAYTPSPPLPYDSTESHYSTLQLEHMDDEYRSVLPVAAPELPARNGTSGGQRGTLVRLGHH